MGTFPLIQRTLSPLYIIQQCQKLDYRHVQSDGLIEVMEEQLGDNERVQIKFHYY